MTANRAFVPAIPDPWHSREHARRASPNGILGKAAAGFLWLLLSATAGFAQGEPVFKDISRAPSGEILLRVEPEVPNPNALLLESSDSPGGPWWTVPGQQRTATAGGYEFRAPFLAYQPQQFYRLGTFEEGSKVPSIRFIAPKEFVRRGQSVTLLGKNFAPTAEGNTVVFSRITETWPATVTAASGRHLTVTVPEDLLPEDFGPGELYEVRVSTAEGGESNRVGCYVREGTFPIFGLRPENSTILLPPGTGKESLALGGGVPPYRLLPQSPSEAQVATAVLDGSILDVTAPVGSPGGLIQLRVEDSSDPPQEDSAFVTVMTPEFTPFLFSEFHTTLENSMPACTVVSSISGSSLQVERTEIRFEGVQLEVGSMAPGKIAAVVEYGSSLSPERVFGHMVVTAVANGRADFDLVTRDEFGSITVACGTLVEQPPAIVIHTKGLKAASLAPAPLEQVLLFDRGIFRLPSGVDTPFSITAVFTSVSPNEDQYLPQQWGWTQELFTTGSAGPRLERVVPTHAQVSAYVKLQGSGMGPDSAVTFAGSNGPVPAVVKAHSAGGLTVVVPAGADVTGPVTVTSGGQPSNGYLFSPRFHPAGVLRFDTFQANTPTALHLDFHQLADTGNLEAGIGRVVATMDGGSFDFSGLTEFDTAGTMFVTEQTGSFESEEDILYLGTEEDSDRHVFESAFVRFFLSNHPGGSGVILEVELTDSNLRRTLVRNCHFSTPIYLPPSPTGTAVKTRLEFFSQPWRSAIFPPLHVVRNFSRNVQP